MHPVLSKRNRVAAEIETPDDRSLRLPILEETISVEKRRVQTGRVRVTSTATSEEVPVRETLTSTCVRVEHVPVDRLVDTAPPPRTEGSRTIVSVTEEVMVKRVRIIEEIHLIREERTDLFDQTITLRRLDVEFDHVDTIEGEKRGQTG